MKKPMFHYVPEYFFNPQHPITVAVVGCGGTGSNVLVNLVALHLSLKAMDHPGLAVYCFDDDIVSEANAARQMFYPSDIGNTKVNALISRINRSYGLDWTGITKRYDETYTRETKEGNVPITFNITIGCVDTIASRRSIDKAIKKSAKIKNPENRIPYYWLDIGNTKNAGQIVLGTITTIKKKFDHVEKLPTIIHYLKGKKDKKNDNQPSCSLVEALSKQDCYINKMMATLACNMIWRMFRRARLEYRGVYFNFETLQTNPIQL